MRPGKDILTYLPARIVLALTGFISVPIITRLFEPVHYGKYVLAISLVRVMSMTAAWVSGTIIRFYPEYEVKGRLAQLCSTVNAMSLMWLGGIGALYAAILWLLGGRLEPEFYRLLWLGLPLFILSAAYDTLLEFLRARRRLVQYSGYVIWRAIMALALGLFIAIVLFTHVDALMYGTIACLLIVIPKMWREALPDVESNIHNVSRPLARELTSYGIPILISSLSAWVMTLSDRYLINYSRGEIEVGIYAASFAVAEYSLSIIASLIGLTSGGIVFHLWEKEGEAKAKEFMTTMTRFLLIVSVPAAVGLSLLAEPVISLITSKQYHDGYRIVPFIVLGAFFIGLQQRYHAGIGIVKKNHLLTVSLIVSAVVNVALNLLFVPRYGYMAASINMAVSSAMLFVLVVVLSRRHIVWAFPFACLIRVCLASTVMAAAVFGLQKCSFGFVWADILIAAMAGSLIYFAMLYVLREYDTAFVKRTLESMFSRVAGKQ